MLNWLPNVEYNKESRFFTTKDIAENAEKLQTADKALRDLKRKRAIERATAESIDAKGDFKEELARESLKKSGFGEEADTLVNEITSKKTAKTKENIDFRKNLLEAVALGTVKQDVAEKLFGGPLQDTIKEQTPAAPQLPPVASPDVRSGGLPLSPAAQALIKGSQGPQQASPTTQIQSAPITSTSQGPSQSNLSPRYAQMGPMDFSQLAGGESKVAPITFSLSDDPLLASYQKKAAAGALGGLDDKASNETIAARIEQIAQNKFPEKKPTQFMGSDGKIDTGKYLDYKNSRLSNIEGHKQELVKSILLQGNEMRSQDLTTKSVQNAIEQTNITKDEKYIPGYQKATDQKAQEELAQSKSASTALSKSATELERLDVKDPGWRAAASIFATNVAQAEGMPGNAGTYEEILSNLKKGADWETLLKANPNWQDKLNALAQFGFDAKTKGPQDFRMFVKFAQLKAREKAQSKFLPNSYTQLFTDFPIDGETALDKESYKKKHPLGLSVGGVNRPPEKPKTAKEKRDEAIEAKKLKDKRPPGVK